MSLSVETYALSKKYTNDSISGISGALAGKNCTIQSITDIEGGHRVTFQWTADDSTVRTSTMDVMDGSGAEAIEQIYADNGVLGAKNLLENTASTQTVNDVTFTVNDDGSITANGQASANASVTIATYLTLPKEIIGQNVILTGCPEGGSTDGKYFMNAIGFRSASSGDTDTGNGVQINNVYDFTANTATKIYIEVRSGYNAQNLTFYPMLRLASDTDSTYVPYAETNYQLTKNKVSWDEQAVLGAKNLLENTASNKSNGNVSWTVNADKSVTINTSAAASSVQTLHIGEVTGLQGDYILNGVTGGTISTFGIQLYDVTTSTWTTQYALDGDSIINLADKNHTYRFVAFVREGVEVSNKTIYPMLRLASDPDDTYVPYAMTNRELTEAVFEKNVLSSADNLDNIKETGIYSISTAPTNAPEGKAYSTMIVKANVTGNSVLQIVFASYSATSQIYTRFLANGTWSSWFKYTGTVVS